MYLFDKTGKIIAVVWFIISGLICLWIANEIDEIFILATFIFFVISIAIILNIIKTDKDLVELMESTQSIYIDKKAAHKEGLPGTGFEYCDLCIRKSDLLIKFNTKEFILSYDKIYNVRFLQNYEMVQNFRTTVTNKKIETVSNNQRVVTEKYLVVSYYDDNSIMQTITFQGGNFNNFVKLQDEINQRLPQNILIGDTIRL